jgi:hypothetical protein
VGQNFRFKFVSQVAEKHGKSYYAENRFSSLQAKKDVDQFVDICNVLYDALPKHYETLKVEPRYVWVGKTELWEDRQTEAAPLQGVSDRRSLTTEQVEKKTPQNEGSSRSK